jgi:hypothetical protein
MLKRLVASVGLFVLAAALPAAAQGRAEVGVNVGWNFSDGVEGDPIIAGDGNVYDRVDPKDGATFGFNVGFHVTPNAEVGFMYGYQASTLLVGGTNEVEIGDLGITTYHGYFGYNFGESDAPMRPFVFGGLGATNFGSVDFAVAGRVGTINGETQFSTTWGGGVKFFPAPRIGVRVAAQFTPTYIKSDAAGWWCDPYWGCYLVGDAQYSNQFGFNGGVVFRF